MDEVINFLLVNEVLWRAPESICDVTAPITEDERGVQNLHRRFTMISHHQTGNGTSVSCVDLT